jgi:two-component system response regulator PilR (NtrC family)
MLDEVADLPLAMQVKLLRAIQERRVRKVGATAEEAVDVRILSATHQNLEACVSAGKFRQDLYYRLNVIELLLPPLRQRLSDVSELAACILIKLATPAYPISLNQAALAALQAYDFPGNVRELENILERAAAFANDGCIDVIDLGLRASTKSRSPIAIEALESNSLSPTVTLVETQEQEHEKEKTATQFEEPVSIFAAPTLPCVLPDYLEQIEREVIRAALAKTRNNRTNAAELLGISFRQLRYSIQKLKINDVDAE